MRSIDFIFRVLRNGAELGYLTPDGAPALRCDKNAQLKTMLSGSFLPVVVNAMGTRVEPEWTRDEIAPSLVINGTEHPLGFFLPAKVTTGEAAAGETLSITAYDRAWRLRDSALQRRLYLTRNTSYLTAIEQQLTAAGISAVLVTASSAKLPEDREYPPGTSRLQIVNELLSEISYNDLWFNAYGAAVLEPHRAAGVDTIRHTLDSSDPETLMLPGLSRETDLYSAPNVWIVLVQNPEKNVAMWATATNNNPQSPLSVLSRGREIVKVITVDNIANQTALQAYADHLRDESLIGGETLRVQTALQPGWGVGDCVAVHYNDLTTLCVSSAWDMALEVGGKMTHTLERVVFNLVVQSN